jgi:hypothetical protein
MCQTCIIRVMNKLFSQDVRGSNPGGGEIFRSRPDRPRGPPSLLYNGYRVSFPGVKRPGREAHHPPSSSAKVKERVELYLYSPSGPSWTVLGRTLPLPLHEINSLKVMAVCCKNHTEHIHSVGKIWVFFFKLKQVVHIVTTVLYGTELNFIPLLHPGISGMFLPSTPWYFQ